LRPHPQDWDGEETSEFCDVPARAGQQLDILLAALADEPQRG
jgi:hypothetical protein